MSERYCPKCGAEVADLGGYCALGHSLMLRPLSEISDLGDLKAEVNKAFAEAELQVASVLASVTGEMERVQPNGQPTTRPAQPAAQPMTQPGPPPAQPAAPTPPPPPPPAPYYADEFDEFDVEAKERSKTFWKALDEEDPEAARHDPITAFAPAPRMDWGPDKAPGKKTRRKP